MRVALVLDGWTTRSPDRARDATTQLQVVVRGVDDCVDPLLHKVTADDHDSRRNHSFTSAIRSSTSFGVALAMPRIPIDSMVNEAHATPHTSASCNPER